MWPEEMLVIIKPDATRRGATLDIIAEYRAHGFIIKAHQILTISLDQARGLYAEHAGQWFYPRLLEQITSGPAVLLYLVGREDMIKQVRELNGATNPAEAVEGTIRRRYGTELPNNAVHASADLGSAKRELTIFFSDRP